VESTITYNSLSCKGIYTSVFDTAPLRGRSFNFMKDLFDIAPVEIWKDIQGWEGYYQISTFIRIRSMPRIIIDSKHKRVFKGRILKLILDRRGYKRVQLHSQKKNIFALVHRLFAQAFIPNPENYPCINHINGIKTDNRLENLEWCTYKQNTIHAYKTGLLSLGEGDKSRNKKLTEEIVKIIKSELFLYKDKYLATKYNVSREAISRIRHGRSWKSVKIPQ
jgi:hypothetical protein